jgi:outer membrane protein assembly factor BamB
MPSPPPPPKAEPVSAVVPGAAAGALDPVTLAKISSSRLVSGFAASDEAFYAADASGALAAFALDGRLLWTAKTANSENGNSRPVYGSGIVAFAGDKELVALDAATGKRRFALPLDAGSSGLFGRRPALLGDKLFIATSGGIEVLDAAKGGKLGAIALPDGVESTPAVAGARVYAVTSGGAFCTIDGEKLSLVGQVKTSALQPVAAAPILLGKAAYFVDRKGLAVRIDLESGSVAWEKRLDSGKNLNSMQDPAVGEVGLYVFAKSTIYALSLETGERLFPPIQGASSPPTVDEGILWFGTQDGRIAAVDAKTGTRRASLATKDRAVGAPERRGDELAFPGESGAAIILRPKLALR